MWCVKCDKDLADCVCPDLKERLASLSAHPNLALTFCSGCGEYYSRCKCASPKPDVEMRSAGGIVGMHPAPVSTMARLENWSVFDDGDPYQAPECRGKRLQGNVYGHPRFADGDYVHTSTIARVSDGRFVTKSGTRYELGEVDPAYEAAYPNAKDRLLAVFGEARA